MRQIEMKEYGAYDGRVGEGRDDAHVSAAGGTDEGEHLEDAGEESQAFHWL